MLRVKCPRDHIGLNEQDLEKLEKGSQGRAEEIRAEIDKQILNDLLEQYGIIAE